VVRLLNWDLTRGMNMVRVYNALQFMRSAKGGLEGSIIEKVEIILSTPAESKAYEMTCSNMAKQQGRLVENVLFFGSVCNDPLKIVHSADGLDEKVCRRSVIGDREQGSMLLAERPTYSDCFSFAADPSGRSRQIFIVRALIGKAEKMLQDWNLEKENHDTQPALHRRGSSQQSPLVNCRVYPPHKPFEYQPEKLGLTPRDVDSKVYAIQDPKHVLPVAVVTYRNPASECEFAELRKHGFNSWRDCYFNRVHNNPQQERALDSLALALEKRDLQSFDEAKQLCDRSNVDPLERKRVLREKRSESEAAGICLAYVIGEDFERKAKQATGEEDPTFVQMGVPFFHDGKPLIGEGRLCPRDLREGCSFVDSMEPVLRQQANIFLSWVWGYKLSVVQSGLKRWAKQTKSSPRDVFVFMCFFCNNQWRILVEGAAAGSDNLEVIFSAKLKMIGRLVALMDDWSEPLYLTRVWTIYEQYVASTLGDKVCKVQFILPESPAQSLITELDMGKSGIEKVIEAITKVDVETSRASYEADEKKVKELIRKSTGFDAVNAAVRSSIVDWVATEFKQNIDLLVNATKNGPPGRTR